MSLFRPDRSASEHVPPLVGAAARWQAAAMRRIVLAMTIALLATAVGVAGAASGDYVTVTPTTGLSDGDSIRVTGPSGDANAALYCATADTSTCEILGDNFFGPLDFTISAQRFVVHENLLLDCATAECHVGGTAIAIDGPAPFVPPRTIFEEVLPIEFVPTRAIEARKNAPAMSETGLIAASFLNAPAGSLAFAMRCGNGGGVIVCGDIGSIEPDFDGNFSGTYPNPQVLAAGDDIVFCDVSYCGVAVVVLGPGPAIVDVIATPDPRWN